MNEMLVTTIGAAVTTLFGAMALLPLFVNPKAQVQDEQREDHVLSIRPIAPEHRPTASAVRPVAVRRQGSRAGEGPREAA